MEIGLGAGHRLPGEMAPPRAGAVDGVGVRCEEPGRKLRPGDARPAPPARSAPLGAEFESDLAVDDLAAARQPQCEPMTVGAEFQLEVAVGLAEQEELDDFVIPEPEAAARGHGGRGIAVEARLERDLERVADRDLDPRPLVVAQGRAVPARSNLESMAVHAYNPPRFERRARVRAEGWIEARVTLRAEEREADLDGSPADDRTWQDGGDTRILPARVRAAFRELEGPIRLRPTSGGLINQSFHVRAGAVEYMLQRVSEIFAPEIQQNIRAVSEFLVARGFRAPRLIPTRAGELAADLGELGRWRLMEHLGGATFERLASPEQAHSAGALVGRFHAELRDFDAPLHPMGIPYRNTPLYLEALGSAVAEHRGHRLHAETDRLARRIFAAFEEMGASPTVPLRVIHGDLKVSNLLFEAEEGPGRDRAFALVDFDTLMRGTLWMELGDAWRSWCNAAGEDTESPRFDLEIFAASCEGFATGYGLPLDPAERDSLETGPERITLELCARFAADALVETYWGWDSSRFPARGEHNALRAEGQWRLYEAARATRARRRELLRRLG